MKGNELIDFLIISGQIKNGTYEDYTINRMINSIRAYDKEIGSKYKLLATYFGDIYRPCDLLVKLEKLGVKHDLSENNLMKLIDNIRFLASAKIDKRDFALDIYISRLDKTKYNKLEKLNEFKVNIGCHGYYLKTLDNNILYLIEPSDKDGITASKLVEYTCRTIIDHVKYVVYNFKLNDYDIVRTIEFNSNKDFYISRDKDRLKISFTKY